MSAGGPEVPVLAVLGKLYHMAPEKATWVMRTKARALLTREFRGGKKPGPEGPGFLLEYGKNGMWDYSARRFFLRSVSQPALADAMPRASSSIRGLSPV